MASTGGNASHLPSPPESPNNSRQNAQANGAPQALENQPHIAPQDVETEDSPSQADMSDDGSSDEEENDIESFYNENDDDHVPSFQQIPIRPSQPASFPNSTGYESPPPSQPRSQGASRRLGDKRQARDGHGQVHPQRKEQTYETGETTSNYAPVFEHEPQSSRARRSNKTSPSVPKTSAQNEPYPFNTNNDSVAGPLNYPAQGGLTRRKPTYENPAQVPVRVANPNDLVHPMAEKTEKASLRIKLDLNLEVEIMLKASVKGDLTLALFN